MIRTLIRIASFIFAAGLFWFSAAPLSHWFLSPLGATAAIFSVPAKWGVWLIFAFLILASLFFRRFFCRWLCPLGLLHDATRLLARPIFSGLKFSPRWTLLGKTLLAATFFALIFGGVGFLWLDPFAIFSSLGQSAENRRLGAILLTLALLTTVFVPHFWCAALCPCGALSDFLFRFRTGIAALFRPSADPQDERTVPPNGRRSWFRAAANRFGAIFFAVPIFALFQSITPKKAVGIRPPGARNERAFLARCLRCGRCLRVCPTELLQSSDSPAASVGTPSVDFSRGFCDADCNRCGEVCPTGAIRPLSLKEKADEKMALAKLNLEDCRLWHDRECAVCRRECPTSAIQFVWDEEEYLNIPVIDEKLCSGCGRCAHFCPGFDENAKGIVMIARENRRD